MICLGGAVLTKERMPDRPKGGDNLIICKQRRRKVIKMSPNTLLKQRAITT